MLELLQTHLENCFSADESNLIQECIQLMAEMNVNSDDYYSDLFMRWEQGLVDDLNMAIRAAVMTDAQNIVMSHGFDLIEDALMSDYLKFLRFFVQVEGYENPTQLYLIATSEEMDTAEKLATAISEVTAEDVDCILALLENVPEAVLKNMAAFAKQRADEDPGDMEEVQSTHLMLEMLEKFAEKISGKDMECYKYAFVVQAAVGLPFVLYWKTYYDYLISIPVQAMVYELIGFAIISEETDKNPSDLIGGVLAQHYGEDIDKISYAKTVINQTLIEFRNESSSGIFVQRPEANNAKA